MITISMGIDCTNWYRSVHFKPPATFQALIQETGHLGYDGCDFIGVLIMCCIMSIKPL